MKRSMMHRRVAAAAVAVAAGAFAIAADPID
jgi:hypothetical protein